MQALERDIAKYKGKYDAGYEPIRKARFEKEKQLGLIDPNWDLSPQAGEWEKVKNKAWEARCMEVYAAMIDCMDQGVGRIVESLRKTGQLDNTLILFLQDNGGNYEDTGRKGTATRAAAPTPAAARAGFHRDESHPQAHARRVAGAAGDRRDARPGGHVHRLRPQLGERQQHAVPGVQAFRPRGRHRHAADRPLAGRHHRARANSKSNPAI